MNIHEFQAKSLLAGYGLPVPEGGVAETVERASEIARDLGGGACMVKAQIHAGGRGKAGGVQRGETPDGVGAAAGTLLGQRLVTYQTGAAGRSVKRVLVEKAEAIARELYLALLVDRSAGRVALLGATEGGEDIETRAAADPAAIRREVIDPDSGLQDKQAKAMAKALGLGGAAAKQAVALMQGLYKAFTETDASLIEVNPLAVTEAGALLALDVKMSLDDNALFRHADLAALRDQDEVDPSELEAQRYEVNFVKLEGNIGCVVNGAGLALATIDILKAAGGEPADFMDIRPTATRDQVATALGMVMANPKVRAILVNLYGGGIQRCDTIADGIAKAMKSRAREVPLIVRAAGTNADIARKSLTMQGVPVTFAGDMAEAARLAVAAVGREAA